MKDVKELMNRELIQKLRDGSRNYPVGTLIGEVIQRFDLYMKYGDISELDAREHIEGAWMEGLEDEEPEIREPRETLRR